MQETGARRTFVVFEGGGARGLFHLATLRAIERAADNRELDLAGVAGTSAGAIVASLAAAGYRAKDLLDMHEDENGQFELSSVLYNVKVDGRRISRPTQLFKWWHWQSIRLVRLYTRSKTVRKVLGSLVWLPFVASMLYVGAFLTGTSGNHTSVVFFVLLFLVAMFLARASRWLRPRCPKPIWLSVWVFFVTLGLLFSAEIPTLSAPQQGDLSVFHSWLFWAFVAAVLLSFSAALLVVRWVFRVKGIASLRRVEAALDFLFAAKFSLDAGERLTFGRLAKEGRRLDIVAANVTAGRMEVFSTENGHWHHLPVAKAVVASAAIPGLFRPVQIENEDYCDGGMVSNLPAWVFDPDTVNDANAWVVASNLIPDDQRDETRGNYTPGFLANVFRTALFGADPLSVRGIRNLLPVEIDTWNGLLDFDFHRYRPSLTINFPLAVAIAELQIKRYLAELAKHRELHATAVRLLSAGGCGAARIRSALVRGNQGDHTHNSIHHLWSCLGFGEDGDRHHAHSGKKSFISASIERNNLIALNLERDDDCRVYRRNDHDGLLWDRMPDDRNWVCVLPLPPRSRDLDLLPKAKEIRQVSLALVVDGDGAFPQSQDFHEQMFEQLRKSW